MASASHITIMRELSAAGDRERTGAFDVEWEGAKASLFFIFGHANHVEFERSGGEKLVGTEALTAIVEELPEEFQVSPWRRAMVTDDTLRCTAEELMFMFRRDPAKSAGRVSAGAPLEEDAGLASDPAAEQSATDESAVAEATNAEGTSDESTTGETTSGATTSDEPTSAEADGGAAVPFGLADFPELPHGEALFSDAAQNVEGLAAAVPHLPNSPILLEGASVRGAVLIGGGTVVDAVRVDDSSALIGESAAAAVFSAGEGTITAHRIDDPSVFAEMSALWRPSAPAEVAEPEVAEPEVAETAAAEPEAEVAEAGTPVREPAVFSLPDLADAHETHEPEATVAPPADDPASATGDEALAAPPSDDGLTSSAGEFVPARVDVDIDALRTELIGIANVWLGEADAAPVAAAIMAARPGVDDFVAAIQAIASLHIAGHEHAVVRAMAREMHFRAAEVLCGV